jgi:hypothetical protein
MGSDDFGERIAVLETQMKHVADQARARSTREWGVIMAVLSLLLAVVAKNFGWIQ